MRRDAQDWQDTAVGAIVVDDDDGTARRMTFAQRTSVGSLFEDGSVGKTLWRVHSFDV